MPRLRPTNRAWGASLVLLLGLVLLVYPSGARWFGELGQANLLNRYVAAAEQEGSAANLTRIRDAEASNAAMVPEAFLLPGVPAVSWTSDSDAQSQIPTDADLLDLGEGVLARLTIPGVGIDAPVLRQQQVSQESGIRHIASTSLPVGGAGSLSVITAGAGSATDPGFQKIGAMRVGDRITLQVLCEPFAYQVVKTETVAVTQELRLTGSEGSDQVALVMAPSTQATRLVVIAERTEPSADQATGQCSRAPGPGFPWWILWVGAGIVVIGLSLLLSVRLQAARRENESAAAAPDDSAESLDELDAEAEEAARLEYLNSYTPDPRMELEREEEE